MTEYICKCGKTFTKSTSAAVTGYRDTADCTGCPYLLEYGPQKWDGSGYPEGRAGEEIPFEARVMALADVFDALVSKRVYKEQFSFEKALSIIWESSGSHFDPVLCKQFLDCRDRLVSVYSA